MDMGLTTTSLLNAEKFPVIVPNSLFSSQVSNTCMVMWNFIYHRLTIALVLLIFILDLESI